MAHVPRAQSESPPTSLEIGCGVTKADGFGDQEGPAVSFSCMPAK